jgi:hypothetical protein
LDDAVRADSQTICVHCIGVVQAFGDWGKFVEVQEDRAIDNTLVPVYAGVGDGDCVSAAGTVV